ncbi:hypothetical protein [Haloarcula brevis]|uniref:hypothetical protein n=1 Tax=Haloarcula brevis TaxID=3111453 RepID=UPI00300EC0D7
MVRGTQVQLALAAVVGFLAVEMATRTGTSMAWVGGAFVAAVVLVGPAAPLGGVAGLVIHDAFHGVIGYWTVATAVWILTFTGVVAWLSTEPDGRGLESMHRTAPAYAGWLVVGGVNATAFAAWLALVLGVQPFYTAVMGYLPGVAVAVGLGVFGLVAVGAAERVGWLPGRAGARGHSLSESNAPGRNSSTGPTLGVFLAGTGWLVGVSALDVFVRDLWLYPTATEFRAFVTGFLGSGSPVATVGTTVLLGVYEYGELAVVLSAPVSILAVMGWCLYHGQIPSPTAYDVEMTHGGPSDD